MIEILEHEKTFHLQTSKTSMIFSVLDSGHLVCLYWGKRVYDQTFSYLIKEIKRASYLSDLDGNRNFKLEQMPLLYPAYGNPDMRIPAFMFRYQDGSRISSFEFTKYKIIEGKKKICGLPTVLSDKAQTIEFSMVDQIKQLEIVLSFSIFFDQDAISQSVRVIIINFISNFRLSA